MDNALTTDVKFEAIPFPRRLDWLAFRKGRWGASDAAAILGANEYKSATAAILEKADPLVVESETNDLRVRRLMEAGILANYRDVTPGTYEPNERAFVRSDAPFMSATPDALGTQEDGSRIVVELKTSSSTLERWLEDGVPLRYQVQVQQQMFCVGYARADVAVLFTGGSHFAFRAFRFDADADFQAILVEKLRAAWALVEAVRRGDNAPLPAAGPDDGRLLARLRKPTPATVTCLGPDDAALAQEWLGLVAERSSHAKIAKGYEELEKRKRNTLIARMGGAEVATFAGSTLRLKAKVVNRPEHEVSNSSWVELKEIKE